MTGAFARARKRTLSAGNTADVNNLSRVSISLSPNQAGAPVFPTTLDA
jgi:hypothetical protein